MRFFSSILGTIVVTAFQSLTYAQPTLDWAISMTGSGGGGGTSVVVDASGNIYSTGYYDGTVDFDPGAGTTNLVSNAASVDVYIHKTDASGNLIWVKSIGSSGPDVSNSIALDASNNVYVFGYFSNTVDFNPDAGVFNLTSNGSYDLFILKLNSTGNFVWAKSMGGTGVELSSSIVVDGLGNIHTTGRFTGTVDFDPGVGTFNLTSAGGSLDIFIQKLDALGNFVWARSMGSTSTDEGNCMAVDALGNVYTTGSFTNTADFDPGVGTFNLTSAGVFDIYIQKLNSAGNFVWAKSIGGSGTDKGQSIDVDALGNVYIGGRFSTNSVDFDPGVGVFNLSSVSSVDAYILKLDASGNFVWAGGIGGSFQEYINSIVLDDVGNLYVMSDQYSATVDYDIGGGTFALTNTGTEAHGIAKYDENGVLLCGFIITPGHNEAHSSRHMVTSGNKLYFTTSFNDASVDFDPCIGVANVSNGGLYDIAVAKYDMTNCNCSPPLSFNKPSFIVEKLKSSVLTKWTVSKEMSNDYFEVFRSEDGKTFQRLTVINVKENRNSYNYSFTDKKPLNGVSYYKLKFVDKQGREEYSEMHKIQFNNTYIINLYPNPVNKTVNLTIDCMKIETIKLKISNSTGQIVYKKEVTLRKGNNELELSTSDLPQGIYIFKVTTDVGNVFTKQFIKQ